MNRKVFYILPFVLVLAFSVVSAIEEYTDVAITDLRVIPENPKLGDEVRILATVKNLGDVRTKIGFSMGVRTPSQSFGMATTPLNLGSGKSKKFSFDFTVDEKGFYYITSSVYSEVPDRNPDNNKGAKKLFII